MGIMILKEGLGGVGWGEWVMGALACDPPRNLAAVHNCATNPENISSTWMMQCAWDELLCGLNFSSLHLAGRLCSIDKLQDTDCRHRQQATKDNLLAYRVSHSSKGPQADLQSVQLIQVFYWT